MTRRRSPWSLSTLIDQGFLVFAGLASFWLAWLVWREAWYSGGWWMVGLFVVVWVITAYLALPRLHRILSSLYVPNYFIGRTRTADGLLGDPVNVAARGSEAQLHRAMQAAGWTLADEITPRSAWRITLATIMCRSYPAAPVSTAFLFGRRQDFAYQQEIDGTPGKRHHVRFWRCPQGWLLPGGHQVDWLAAGTYDRSVGLSLFTLQVTHKIDQNTDIERDYIIQTVTEASPAVQVTNLKDFSTGYHSRNAYGDSIQTDGDLPVLELKAVRAKNQEVARHDVIVDSTVYEQQPDTHDTLLEELWSQRPPQISFAIVLTVIATLISCANLGIDLLGFDMYHQEAVQDLQAEGWSITESLTGASWLLGGSIVVMVMWIIIALWLAWRAFRGSDRSRQLLMVMSAMAALAASWSLTVGKLTWLAAGLLSFIGMNIVIIVMLSSDAARRFTRSRTASRVVREEAP